MTLSQKTMIGLLGSGRPICFFVVGSSSHCRAFVKTWSQMETIDSR